MIDRFIRQADHPYLWAALRSYSVVPLPFSSPHHETIGLRDDLEAVLAEALEVGRRHGLADAMGTHRAELTAIAARLDEALAMSDGTDDRRSA